MGQGCCKPEVRPFFLPSTISKLIHPVNWFRRWSKPIPFLPTKECRQGCFWQSTSPLWNNWWVGGKTNEKVRVVQHKNTKTLFALKYINKPKCVKMKAVANIVQERRLLEEVSQPSEERAWSILLLPIWWRRKLTIDRSPIRCQFTLRIPRWWELFLCPGSYAGWGFKVYDNCLDETALADDSPPG